MDWGERDMQPEQLEAKMKKLKERIKTFDSLAVAFSGGVDSAFLAAVARGVLGEKMVALKAVSPIHPQREHRAALKFADLFDIPLVVIETDELAVPGFGDNSADRCYLCKKYLMSVMVDQAAEMDFEQLAHGANLDDIDDYRPGFKAAEELGIIAPLIEAGLTKAEIRRLSEKMGLPTWNRPSMACLASRVPYNTPVSAGILAMVEQAETVLYTMGLETCRVRHHGSVARIEIDPGEIPRLAEPAARKSLVKKFKAIGYDHICLDLEGYVQGSLNRDLEKHKL